MYKVQSKLEILIPVVLGTPLWFARGCENAAGKLSRGGKQQQGPISPNHVRAIKGPPVSAECGSHVNVPLATALLQWHFQLVVREE